MKNAVGRKMSLLLVLLLSFTMVLSACGGGGNTPKNEPPANTGGNNQGAANEGSSNENLSPLELALKGEYKGTKVTMFGPFVDADQVKFESSIKEFEEKTGIDIQYEGSKE